MYGMHFRPVGAMGNAMAMDGLAASPQVLALIVALLCFLIAVGFLLFLVPDARQRPNVLVSDPVADFHDGGTGPERHSAAAAARARTRAAPLAGLGQPPSRPMATRVPIEAANGTQFIDVAEIRSIRADAHYTLVHDGQRERMCSWPISEAESQLGPDIFMRVHRSHIVAVPHITFMRREGDGAVVELDGPAPHLVPVSRAKIAELKARLGLTKGETAKAAR